MAGIWYSDVLEEPQIGSSGFSVSDVQGKGVTLLFYLKHVSLAELWVVPGLGHLPAFVPLLV